MRRRGKAKSMKLKPYGGSKSKTLYTPCSERCGVCGKYWDRLPKNERVNNRRYKVLKKAEKEYGKEDEE